MGYSSRHHHGDIRVGRIIIAVALLPILAVNWLIFRHDAATPYPVPGMQLAMIIGGLWFVAGAIANGARKAWGHTFILTILYLGMFAFFITVVVVIANAAGPIAPQLKAMIIGITVYLIVTLVLSHSRHVRRLTSRVWE